MEFNDDDDKFKMCGCMHVKHVVFSCALIGIVATLLIFGFGVAVFPWSLYEKSINATAMTAFMCFLTGGVGVHILVLRALARTRFRFMIPAVIYQSFLMCLNGITSLIAVGELVSENPLTTRDETMAQIVLCTCPPVLFCQSFMVAAILRCRYYLQCKRRHIRNGLPPPVREVIHISMTNKVSSIDLGEQREVTPTMMLA